VEVLDGVSAAIGNPAAAAEVVGVVEITQQFHYLFRINFAKITILEKYEHIFLYIEV